MRASKFSCAAFVLFAVSILSARPLRADGTDTYTYKADGNTFTWQLPVNPSPNSSDPTYDFTFSNFTLTENAQAVTGTLDFYSSACSGAFDFWTGNPENPDFLVDGYGPQLFGGSTERPTMLAGSFSILDFAGNDNNPYQPAYLGTLQVTATPEPPALLLLFVGMLAALVLTALRRH